MIRYESEIDLHPLSGNAAIRDVYIALLRKIADDLERDAQIALPGLIFADLEGSAASDHWRLLLRCFHSRNEVRQMLELLSIKE